MVTHILVLIVLIMLNAFFAASEMALISVNSNKVKAMAEQGDKKAILLENLLAKPASFLATIQIGITLAGFLASAFASDNFAEPITRIVMETGIGIPESVIKTLSMVLVTIILSYFTLVLGELVPKRVAMRKAEKMAFFAVRPLRFLSVATSPFVSVLTKSTNIVTRLFGLDPNEKEQDITEEEILLMVDAADENGVLEESQKEMINNIFEMGDLTAGEVMTHRTDIVAVSVDTRISDVVPLAISEGFSRIPVYGDSIDEIIGILYVKDLFSLVGCDHVGDFSVSDFIREVIYFPESSRIMDVFRKLIEKKMHMAVVVDEYGGTAGIITMENIVEEVMGSIQDEYDDEADEMTQISDDTYIILGTADPEHVLEELGAQLPQEHEYDTISGLIVDLLGRIPTEDETPTVTYANIDFTVLVIEDRRIEKIKAVIRSEVESKNDDQGRSKNKGDED